MWTREEPVVPGCHMAANSESEPPICLCRVWFSNRATRCHCVPIFYRDHSSFFSSSRGIPAWPIVRALPCGALHFFARVVMHESCRDTTDRANALSSYLIAPAFAFADVAHNIIDDDCVNVCHQGVPARGSFQPVIPE